MQSIQMHDSKSTSSGTHIKQVFALFHYMDIGHDTAPKKKQHREKFFSVVF